MFDEVCERPEGTKQTRSFAKHKKEEERGEEKREAWRLSIGGKIWHMLTKYQFYLRRKFLLF